MNPRSVAVVDYGVGNLLSVRRGLEYCGANVVVSGDSLAILSASHVVLPGVGAFANGMSALRHSGLDDVVRTVANRGTPLLAICLGMQMLLDESDEFGLTAGLGIIPGRVVPVPPTTATGRPQKVPHIGWTTLAPSEGESSWRTRLLSTVNPGDAVYFVHSFMAAPASASDRLADCLFGDRRLPAVIGRNNVIGCQFHPEKSGKVGLRILKGFLEV